MKRSTKLAVGFAAALSVGIAIAALAQSDPVEPGMMMHGMGGPMGPGMMMHGMHPGIDGGATGPMRGPMAGHIQHVDASFGDDMQLVHAMWTLSLQANVDWLPDQGSNQGPAD